MVSLLGDLAGEGRHIVTDSWYTSQKLSEYLLTVNTTLTGTIKKNRGVPQKLKKMELERDQSAFMRKGDHLICKYQDKGGVHCLTSRFSADLIDGKRFVPGRGWLHYKKPRLIDSYNQIMGGVDKADQLLKYYRYDRKSLAWFKKLALHFIQRMCLNSYVIWKNQHSAKHMEYLEYLSAVIEDLLFQHSPGANFCLQQFRQDHPPRPARGRRAPRMTKSQLQTQADLRRNPRKAPHSSGHVQPGPNEQPGPSNSQILRVHLNSPHNHL